MQAKLPSPQETFSFILGTHEVDRIPLTYGEIQSTFNRKASNPYAAGHLQAINHVNTRLIDKLGFPARDTRTLTNSFKSDMALTWLRELHSLMLTPFLTWARNMDPDNQNPVMRNQIGVYRSIPASNSFSICPDPSLISKILHNWLMDITRLDQEVRPKMSSAFGITKEKAIELERTAYDALLMITTVQPFPIANSRIGRLVENALRLQWRLPWKITRKNDKYEDYIEDLVEYQQSILPVIIKRGKDTRF